MTTNALFINDSGQVRYLFWINYDGGFRREGRIDPGETFNENTFATHPFVSADENGYCKEIFVMTREARTIHLDK